MPPTPRRHKTLLGIVNPTGQDRHVAPHLHHPTALWLGTRMENVSFWPPGSPKKGPNMAPQGPRRASITG
eukprot:6077695-Pyramimonas_sp.AAC.1